MVQSTESQSASSRFQGEPPFDQHPNPAASDITKQKICLHVGCGMAGRSETHHRFQGSEWRHVRLDIDESVSPDVVGDIRTLENTADASVDGVFSSHNLEHLHFNEVFVALQAFHRVLKDRGHLVVVVPDFKLACREVAEGRGLMTLYVSPAGPITPLDMIYGYRPYTIHNPYMRHLTGFTQEWLRSVLIDQGFSEVEVTADHGFNLWGFGRKIA